MTIIISHPGSKAQYKGDTRNHAVARILMVYMVFWVPMIWNMGPEPSGGRLLHEAASALRQGPSFGLGREAHGV